MKKSLPSDWTRGSGLARRSARCLGAPSLCRSSVTGSRLTWDLRGPSHHLWRGVCGQWGRDAISRLHCRHWCRRFSWASAPEVTKKQLLSSSKTALHPLLAGYASQIWGGQEPRVGWPPSYFCCASLKDDPPFLPFSYQKPVYAFVSSPSTLIWLHSLKILLLLLMLMTDTMAISTCLARRQNVVLVCVTHLQSPSMLLFPSVLSLAWTKWQVSEYLDVKVAYLGHPRSAQLAAYLKHNLRAQVIHEQLWAAQSARQILWR